MAGILAIGVFGCRNFGHARNFLLSGFCQCRNFGCRDSGRIRLLSVRLLTVAISVAKIFVAGILAVEILVVAILAFDIVAVKILTVGIFVVETLAVWNLTVLGCLSGFVGEYFLSILLSLALNSLALAVLSCYYYFVLLAHLPFNILLIVFYCVGFLSLPLSWCTHIKCALK